MVPAGGILVATGVADANECAPLTVALLIGAPLLAAALVYSLTAGPHLAKRRDACSQQASRTFPHR